LFVWFVSFIWLNQTNQMNQINQTNQMNQINQKRAVLVTGASGGIGRAISLAFAGAGWSVGVHYYRNKVAADGTLTQVVAAGGIGVLYEADIRESHAVQQMVEAACRRTPVPSPNELT
jgi:NAD(P)-dependent dehydrogenase (short-subunit alcohol dehydrogenase family)